MRRATSSGPLTGQEEGGRGAESQADIELDRQQTVTGYVCCGRGVLAAALHTHTYLETHRHTHTQIETLIVFGTPLHVPIAQGYATWARTQAMSAQAKVSSQAKPENKVVERAAKASEREKKRYIGRRRKS